MFPRTSVKVGNLSRATRATAKHQQVQVPPKPTTQHSGATDQPPPPKRSREEGTRDTNPSWASKAARATAGLTHGSTAANAAPPHSTAGDTWHTSTTWSDCPKYDPISEDLSLYDPLMRLQVAFKTRPLRDGGGKPSWRRMAPWARPASTLARLGAKILALTTPFADQIMWSIPCGSKQHPYPDPLLEDIRQILHPGHQHITPDGQPFYLELISQLANTTGDPDWQYPQILTTGGGLGAHPPLTGSVASQE